MDTHRSCKLSFLKKGTVLAAAGLLALCAVRASAYYTDRVFADNGAKAASLGFSIQGHGAEADLCEDRDHLLPFSEGDSFRVTFRTRYTGNADCYVLPKLEVVLGGTSGREQIRLEREDAEALFENGTAILISDPQPVRPGDLLEYTYRIAIDKAERDLPLTADYAFSLAAAQKSLNEFIEDETVSNQEIFEEILRRFNLDEAENHIHGFTAYIRPEEVWETGGGERLSAGQTHIVELAPEVLEGNGPDHETVWYLGAETGDETEYFAGREARGLTLRLSPAQPETAVRYELINEAGIAASPWYIVRLDGEEVYYSEQDYTPQHDE